jgi:hypothetical protein
MGLYSGKGHSVRAEAKALRIRYPLSTTLTKTRNLTECRLSEDRGGYVRLSDTILKSWRVIRVDKTRVQCKEHYVYPLILRSYRLKLQCSYHHVQSVCFSTLTHLAPISTHLSTPCPCWFTGKLFQLLWKCSLRTQACALHIVTYILIIQDHMLFSSVLHNLHIVTYILIIQDRAPSHL